MQTEKRNNKLAFLMRVLYLFLFFLIFLSKCVYLSFIEFEKSSSAN